VSIYDDYFSPRSITIPVGTAVTWVNKGEEIHNVTGDWGGFMDLKPGSSPWTVPFGSARAGKTYWYHDEYFPGM
jgi:plastocyanin